MPGYVVVAPVVVCKVEDDQHGYAYKHLQSGTPIPAGVDPQWISGHLANGMIAKVPVPAPVDVAPPLIPEPPPAAPPPPPAVSGAGGGGGASSGPLDTAKAADKAGPPDRRSGSGAGGGRRG